MLYLKSNGTGRLITPLLLFLLIILFLNSQARPILAAMSTMNKYFSGWGPGYFGIAISPDGKTAYVSFSQDDSLLVVDTDTYKIIDSIDISTTGDQLDSGSSLLSPDGKKLFVSNFAAGNVMVIDTVNRKLECVLPIYPATIASSLSPDGTQLYITARDGGLYIINIADNSYQRIFVPGVIFGPVMSSKNNPDILYTAGILVDEKQAFKPSFFEFSISKHEVLRTCRISEMYYPVPNVRRLAVNADETFAYFGRYSLSGTDKGAGNFYVFDLKAFKILQSTPIDRGVADFAFDEPLGKIYFAGLWAGGSSSDQQSIQEWDMSTNQVVRNIPVAPSSDQRAIVVDPTNAGYIYMTEGDFNLLRKVELATGREVGRVQFNKNNIQPYAIVANGNIGYIMGQSREIGKIDLSSGQVIGIIKLQNNLSDFGFYKGNLFLGGGNCIYEINPEDGTIIKEYPIEKNICTKYLTFFGNKMATIDFEPGGMIGKELIIFNADTMDILKTIPLPHESHGHKVIVSPDSSKLYIESGPMWGDKATITVIDANTFAVLNKIEIPPDNQKNGGTAFVDGDFDETNRILYLLGFTSIYKINMDDNSLMGIIDLIDFNQQWGREGWPLSGLAGIMLSPSKDKLFVVSGDAHTMLTYDLNKNTWEQSITNVRGYFVTSAICSPDKRYLYTVNEQSDNITMIDTVNQTVQRVIDLDDIYAMLK